MRLVRMPRLVMSAVLVLVGCGAPGVSPDDSSKASPAGSNGPPGQEFANEIEYLNLEPTQGLNPQLASAGVSRVMIAFFTDTLFDYSEDGEIVPWLAEEATPSADGLTWTITVRENAKFSDGSPITAEDVAFSIAHMQAGEVMQGLLGIVEDVSVEGDRAVVLRLSAPSQTIPLVLSRAGSAVILSKAAVEAEPDYFTQPTATSGPYMLTEYVARSHAILEANPHYWNADLPKTPTLRYTFSEDQNSWAAAVESGSADVASIGYADAQRLRAGDEIPVVEADILAPLGWGWDRTQPPFSDSRVRQAVAFVAPRAERREACWFGTGGDTYGNLLRQWDPYYIEIDTYGLYDETPEQALARASELLDEAGWVEDGGGTRLSQGVEGVEDGTPLDVVVPYEANWPAAECHTLLLQQRLAEVGINVRPNSYDPAAFWTDVAENKFTMYHAGSNATNAQDLYLNWFHSAGAETALLTHLSDPEIDRQIDAALQAKDEDEAKAIFHDLEQWQSEELPILITGYQWPQTAVDPSIEGFALRPDGFPRSLMYAVKIEE